MGILGDGGEEVWLAVAVAAMALSLSLSRRL